MTTVITVTYAVSPWGRALHAIRGELFFREHRHGCVERQLTGRSLYGIKKSMKWSDGLKRPAAFIPIAMSLVALATVLIHIAVYGTGREADEGAAAHVWQLLMAGQMPVMVFYAVRWLPRERGRAMGVLGMQVAAALAAAFPVWWLGL